MLQSLATSISHSRSAFRIGKPFAFRATTRSVKIAATIRRSCQFHRVPARAFSASTLPLDEGAGQPSLVLRGPKSSGVHDVGGLESLLGIAVDLSDPDLLDWEQETHALLIALAQRGLIVTDELRRHIESMTDDHYIESSYYCKWATAMTLHLIEQGVISYSDVDQYLLGTTQTETTTTTTSPAYSVGQRVRVQSEDSVRWRKPHLRSPGYIFGVAGIVESYEGYFPDPSYKAFRSMLPLSSITDRKEHLYRVQFRQADVWPEGKGLLGHDGGDSSDTITVEVYENWLVLDQELGENAAGNWEMDPTNALQETQEPHHHHHDENDHHDDHEHLSRAALEQQALELEQATLRFCSTGSIQRQGGTNTSSPVVVGDRLSAALIAILSEKLGEDLKKQLRQIVNVMETLDASTGAKLVVRAWVDPGFEQRLLQDAAAAASELGITTTNANAPTKLKVVPSRLPTATEPGVHNLITCTLCSCYPLSMLGLSPKWYKSRTFRARAVREPRAMLKDSFGLNLLPEEWTIRVHDSTADLRYIVLPPRPAGTEHLTEDELRKLVTRDTMIGVALPAVPS